MTSGGKKDSTYVDDVFSTYLYKGSKPATKSVGNGIKLSNANAGNSINFNNTGSVYVPSSADFKFGTGAFTIEFFAYFGYSTDYIAVFDGRTNSSNNNNDRTVTGLLANGQLNWWNLASNTAVIANSSATQLPANVWAHVAYVREGTGTNEAKLYINGSVVGTGTDNMDYSVNQPVRIGGHNWSPGIFYGSFSNYRVVKGTAVYTSNFTPPTKALTAISGTVLLCFQSNTDPFAAAVSPAGTWTTGTGTMPIAESFGPFTADDGEGGMVWIKSRTNSYFHVLQDTERGTTKVLKSNGTDSEMNTSQYIGSFNNSGFSFKYDADNDVNNPNQDFSSWTFRKQKGFFDVVKYTGTGSARTVAHNLGSVPGMILVKRRDSSDNWNVYHREMHSSSPAGYYMQLNTTDPIGGAANRWNNTSPTATEFTVGTAPVVNANGGTYIAYLFAGGDATNIDITNKTLTNLGDSFLGSYPMSNINDGTAETSNAQSIGTVTGQLDIYVDLTSPHVVTKYKIAPQGGGNTQYNLPTKIEVYGTNNTSSWNLITTSQASYKGWYAGDYRDFPIPGLNSYRYWRIKVLQSRDSNGAATTATSISEWKLEGFSPSLDTQEYKFGDDGDKNIIDTGSYTGSGDSDGPEINLGWEPQWVIIKGTGTVNWAIFDSMRGVATKTHSSTGGDNYIHPDEASNETSNLERIEFTSTGFKIKDGGWINTANNKHIYMAIRRSDGNVGKPVEVGTDVFAMPPGNGSSTIPNFTTNFVTDFATYRKPNTGFHWEQTARLMGTGYVYMNRDLAASHWDKFVFDSMIGFQNNAGHGSDFQAWAWKRHAGFDVQVYDGLGSLSAPRTFSHSLGRAPEMIWVKNCSSAVPWKVWHKDLNNGGASAASYNLTLGSSGGDAQSSNNDIFGGSGNVLPTSTKWTTGGNNMVNENGSKHLSVLFASVKGISKCGSYSGSASDVTVTTGFTPRLVLVKKVNAGAHWQIFDSVRGMGASGNDGQMTLNLNTAQNSSKDYVNTTATGFVMKAGADGDTNAAGGEYIYYAHA